MKQESLSSGNPGTLDACQLLRQCGKNLQDAALWTEFYQRYRRKIVTYLWRAFRTSGRSEEFPRHLDDWVQDVFTKLIQYDGRVICSFRGTTEVSVKAFLA